MRKSHLLLLVLPLALSACNPAKYEWGNYSGSLNDFYSDPKAEPAYQKNLERLTSANSGRKVAPGLYAEYGYEELSHGNVDHAVELFEREKSAWPESAVFMDKAIAGARTHAKPDASSSTNQPTS